MPRCRHAAAPPVRAGADADIILIPPIGQIVAAFLAGGCVVANLIGRKTRRAHLRLCGGIEIRRAVIIQRHPLALGNIGGKARAGFDGQLVQRHMCGAKTDGAGQFGLPLLDRLVRAGVDQVDADAVEKPLCGAERRQAFIDLMRASKEM